MPKNVLKCSCDDVGYQHCPREGHL